MQQRAPQTESQEPLEASPIHPPCGPGVPRPPAAADVRRFSINVGGDNVGLNFVPVYANAGARMLNGVQEREEFAGLISIAKGGECEDGPDGRMGILSTVFPDAGQVPFNIARVQGSRCRMGG
jgi:hypothetical protein